jgi:hypothetical protein
MATDAVSVVALALFATSALFTLWVVVYRLVLHPLAKVPGPKLAALTAGHEFYYDCIKDGGGQHAFKLREMHERYGTHCQLPSRQ